MPVAAIDPLVPIIPALGAVLPSPLSMSEREKMLEIARLASEAIERIKKLVINPDEIALKVASKFLNPSTLSSLKKNKAKS